MNVMPNRTIKESVWTSPTLASLSPGALLHFFLLLPAADDHGCLESSSIVVKGRCYPRRPTISEAQITKWQDELERVGLIRRWNVDGREFAIFLTFSKHQRVRSLHQRKTPPPPSFDDTCRQVPSSDGLIPIPIPIPIPQKIKEQCGEFVLLTEEQHQKLIVRFGQRGAAQRIDNLDVAIGSKGYQYKSHYHTILSWEQKNGVKPEGKRPEIVT